MVYRCVSTRVHSGYCAWLERSLQVTYVRCLLPMIEVAKAFIINMEIKSLRLIFKSK